MKSTAERLAWLRSEVAKLERPELEDLARLTKGHVWLIEHEKRKDIGSSTANKIAKVLGCSSEWLTTGEGEPPSQDAVDVAVSDARARAAQAANTNADESAAPDASE